jgi:hypothetical protein
MLKVAAMANLRRSTWWAFCVLMKSLCMTGSCLQCGSSCDGAGEALCATAAHHHPGKVLEEVLLPAIYRWAHS